MDALSEALASVRMTGAIFYHAECTAPWGFSVPHLQDVAHVLAPGTERLVSYHLVTDGKAVVTFPGEEDIAVTAGDILIIAHGDAHTVSNGSPSTFLDSGASLAEFLAGGQTTMRLGGGGEMTRFVCGYFGCERHADRLFLAGLPLMIKINLRGDPAGEWLESSVRHLVSQAGSARPGQSVLLSRLRHAPISGRLFLRIVTPVALRFSSMIFSANRRTLFRTVLYVKPSSGIFSTTPHALQCTASLSWRCRPQDGQGKRTLLGDSSARARLKNSVTPKIMITTVIMRPSRSAQGDVAEAGRRQRRDGEIQRVGIIRDLLVAKLLGLVDDRGHHENEDRKIGDGKDHFLVAPEKRAVAAQPGQHLNLAQQPQGAQDAQKAAGFSRQRGQERGDRDQVGPGRNAGKCAQRTTVDEQARGEIGQDHRRRTGRRTFR